MDQQLNDSFNKIKNILYKRDAFEKRYSFEELANLISTPNKSPVEEETLKSIALFIATMKESIQDLGTQILIVKDIDFEERQSIENGAREIILIIDNFIDALVALDRTFDFKDNTVNIKISETRLKKSRNAIIHNLNEIKFKMEISETDKEQIRTLVNDIIDGVIDQSIMLRVDRLYEILESKGYIGN
jgi:hypothetical protein